MKSGFIIVAAGKGSRMQQQLPKQFLLLNDRPVIIHTIEKIRSALPDSPIVLVYNSQHQEHWERIRKDFRVLMEDIIMTEGGEERFYSVKNGFMALPRVHVVGVHDGVRPFLNPVFIMQLITEAYQKGSAIPYIHPVESTRITEKDHFKYIAREKICLIQTPQCFLYDWLKLSFNQPYSTEFTDEARMVENFGFQLNFVPGLRENIKITTPFDYTIARAIISTGQGDNFL